MKQRIEMVLENYGLLHLVRVSQRYGMGYIVKVKDGDGDIKEYRGLPPLVKKALEYDDFHVEKDNEYDFKRGEYSFYVTIKINESKSIMLK